MADYTVQIRPNRTIPFGNRHQFRLSNPLQTYLVKFTDDDNTASEILVASQSDPIFLVTEIRNKKKYDWTARRLNNGSVELTQQQTEGGK